MTTNHHYDTVAFDVRENAAMLFFARTTDSGDIDDYLLLMRAVGDDFDDSVYLEINEQQAAGHDPISEVQLNGNMLTLRLREPVKELAGITELVLTFADTAENKASLEAGAFRVLGDKLTGGNA
ncbi:MAG: hypothetical protein GXP15_08740 [Gammaproteobacteria bacterium]|nr:hypothetical protein [Gammaproteobacteria bacterium]